MMMMMMMMMMPIIRCFLIYLFLANGAQKNMQHLNRLKLKKL